MNILSVGAAQSPMTQSAAAKGPSGAGFSDKLSSAIDRVSDAQGAADDKLAQLASGQDADLHGTMIAMEEADITLRTMVTVRDKVVSAYQEIMNMAI
jgi:flagellar hook-basal body complex protein FliE